MLSNIFPTNTSWGVTTLPSYTYIKHTRQFRPKKEREHAKLAPLDRNETGQVDTLKL